MEAGEGLLPVAKHDYMTAITVSSGRDHLRCAISSCFAGERRLVHVASRLSPHTGCQGGGTSCGCTDSPPQRPMFLSGLHTVMKAASQGPLYQLHLLESLPTTLLSVESVPPHCQFHLVCRPSLFFVTLGPVCLQQTGMNSQLLPYPP